MPLNNPNDLTVPAVNSAANVTMRDVVGNKADAHLANSLMGRVRELYDNFQRERFVYPSLGPGAGVVSPAAAWTYGNYGVVVPAGIIASAYHVVNLSIESCSVANGIFQLEIYRGAADDVITAVRFSVVGGFWGNSVYDVGSGEIDANDQVRARLASSVGVATITMSVTYFPHA